jgi:hypothetical protein
MLDVGIDRHGKTIAPAKLPESGRCQHVALQLQTGDRKTIEGAVGVELKGKFLGSRYGDDAGAGYRVVGQVARCFQVGVLQVDLRWLVHARVERPLKKGRLHPGLPARRLRQVQESADDVHGRLLARDLDLKQVKPSLDFRAHL